MLINNLLVICCNGGFPLVDLSRQPNSVEHDATSLVDLTDWVASEQPLDAYLASELSTNATDRLAADGLSLPAIDRTAECDVYNLTFSTGDLRRVFAERGGQLVCRCPAETLGDACEILASAFITKSPADTGISASTMYIIVIPIGFLLLAIIGAFIIKFVFHDLAECRYLPCCVSTDKTHDSDCENAAMDDAELQRQPVAGRSGTTNRTSATTSSGPPLDQNAINSLLERASQSKFGVSRTHAPTSSAHPAETECFLLPAVMDNCPPDYSHYAHHRQPEQTLDHEVSPPPSYKSSDASTPPADLIAATAQRRQFF